MSSEKLHLPVKGLTIAFDAKRAYQNGTGLGHYSRTLISTLAKLYPRHQYYLCAPKLTNRFNSQLYDNVHDLTPSNFLAKQFRSAWRSKWVTKDLLKIPVDIYHGLSHEIPLGIQNTGIKTVVTVHDLIFERYPEQYKWLDVKIYRAKFKYACKNADHIIAISQQTKDDIIEFYQIPAEKITVCYQSCNPAYQQKIDAVEAARVSNLYSLPNEYLLYVGSIIERKNLLNICKSLALLKDKTSIPLVVIGDGDGYKSKVVEYLNENGLQDKVLFLSDQPAAIHSSAYQHATDFPAIYQMARCMIYPSVFEGFGIPVLEALWSGTPVITSNISCLPETGGNAALYVDPYSPQQIADAIMQVINDRVLAADMIEEGYRQAKNFTPENCAAAVMQVYLRL